MTFNPKHIIFVACAVVLIGAAVVALWPRGVAVEYELPDFKNNLASEADGWSLEDRPVAQSEEVVNRIEKQLAFDDGLYRIYRYGDVSVAVWAAYWKPESADIMDVHTHEPDSCWVHGGWGIEQRAELFDFELPGERKLMPAKYRLMEKAGAKVHIAFWHLVGGVNLKIDRNEGSLTKYPKIIEQTGVQNKGEQFFFRISSTHPFEDLISDPGFRKILESLGELGLYEQRGTREEQRGSNR